MSISFVQTLARKTNTKFEFAQRSLLDGKKAGQLTLKLYYNQSPAHSRLIMTRNFMNTYSSDLTSVLCSEVSSTVSLVRGLLLESSVVNVSN